MDLLETWRLGHFCSTTLQRGRTSMPIHARSATHLDAHAASNELWPLFRWLAPLIFTLVYLSIGVGPAAGQTAADSTVTVLWTASGDDGATGTATSYDIRYSTSAITASNWSAATQPTGEPAPAAAGTAQTYTITGLTPSRTYYIAMKTTDDAGNISVLSNVPSGTTADTIAPAPVTDLSLNPDSEPADWTVQAGPEIQMASDAR